MSTLEDRRAARPQDYRDETGMMQLCLMMLAGMIGVAVLGFAGAGWWSMIAFPACIALHAASALLRC